MKRTAAVGFLLALASAARASSPEMPVIRISVDLVQVDAVVTDGKGRHVTDLRPEDFTLEEGGKRQRITNVVYVRAGASRTDPSAVEAGASEPVSAGGRTLIFVVDDLGMSLESMVAARRALNRFAEQPFARGDRVALLRTGQDESSFTFMPSREAFAKATAELRHNLQSGRGATSMLPASSSPLDARALTPGSYTQMLFRRRVAFLLGTIDGQRSLPGRKALVLLSEGFSVGTRRPHEIGIASAFESIYGDSDIQAALRMLTDMANRAAVVTYAIDPRGLESDFPTAADRLDLRSGPPTSQMDLMRARHSARFDSQGTLQELADRTGGLTVLNRNDLVGGLAEILDDQRGYYLVGYEPAAATFEKSSGKPRFHKVKVGVTRPGLKVRSRAGFYGISDEEVAKKAPAPVL